ncbi:thioredoxin-like isoform X2 [Sebastes fasciatus]|uniref:thioredoxin-like isoform X2 n=1 Tax=Sebastes fasciatus TaxID=394691 RepID=UPI003D9E610F
MREVTTLEEFEAILKEEAGDKLVAVDFKAKCCCHCQMIGPKFEEMEKTFADEKKEVIFLKVDVTEGAKIIEEYPVKAIPTFMFFKDAKKLWFGLHQLLKEVPGSLADKCTFFTS